MAVMRAEGTLVPDPDRAPSRTRLYRPRIEHVDVRAALFRECEAMVTYAGASGIALNEAIRGKVGLLDLGIDRRGEVVMSELVELHGLLARAVEPATPRSLELMRWDAQVRPVLHAVAPVPGLRRLLFLALAFLLLFCAVCFSGEITLTTVESPLLLLQGGAFQVAMVLAFYFSLAGVGATFKALYDAYQYVQEGRYDPRLDSTYYMRIGLGLIAGLLLAQVLNTFVQEPTGADAAIGVGTAARPAADAASTKLVALGKPLLALIGGFAAQLVYRILSRLVEAVESIFRPEVRTQLQLQERELRASQQQAEAERSAALAGRGAALASELREESDPVRRQVLVDELMAMALPGFRPAAGGVVASTVATAAGAVEGMVGRAERLVGLGRTVVDLLPEGRATGARTFVREAEAALHEVETLRRQAASGDAVGAAKHLLERILGEQNPITRLLRGAVGSFGAVVARGVPGLAVAASPAGLVLGVVAITARLGQEAYERWKVRVLEAPYRPELLPPASITVTSVLPALRLSPTFREVFADLLEQPEPPVILEIGELALADEGQALRARYPDRLADPETFARGLAEFRRVILGDVLAPDVPLDVVAAAGLPSPQALLLTLDAVRDDPTARPELELVALLGDRVRSGAITLADVEEALRAAEGSA